MSKPQLVVCGSIAIDRIMNFSGRYRELIQPSKLHALSISMLLDKLEDSRGGIGANITASLAILGEQPVLLASAGADAELYIKELNELGVDTSHVHFSDLPSASFNVITDSEDSQIGGFFQGAMSDSDSLSFKPWQGREALMVVSAHNPEAMSRQVAECQQFGLRLVYDPGQQVSDPTTDLGAGVEAAEVLVTNDYELGILCEKTGFDHETLRSKLPLLITTLGRNGAVIDGKIVDKPLQISIAEPTEVVDPTGAGDGWRAGFLYGYLRQWDMRTSGQLGATVASFIVEHHGTQPRFSKHDIISRYRENFKEEITL